MTIHDLKDLKKLIQLCHSTGVVSIKVDGIELLLGNKPTKPNKNQSFITDPLATAKIQYTGDLVVDDKIETEELTEEQMLFYSAQGHEPTEQLS